MKDVVVSIIVYLIGNYVCLNWQLRNILLHKIVIC